MRYNTAMHDDDAPVIASRIEKLCAPFRRSGAPEQVVLLRGIAELRGSPVVGSDLGGSIVRELKRRFRGAKAARHALLADRAAVAAARDAAAGGRAVGGGAGRGRAAAAPAAKNSTGR